MFNREIVGRQRELARIAELIASPEPAFVAVYSQ